MGFLWTHFQEGGWGMWAILLITTIPIFVLIVERSIVLFKARIDKNRLLALLKSQIMAGNVQGAIKVCAGQQVPLTRILQAGLAKYNRPDAEIQAAMDEAALHELPLVEKRTGYLAMLGNLATLLGLLGTITGLIKSFAGVAGVDPSMKATLLAKGISEAMNCTAFGLGTGIMGLLVFALLNGNTQHILDDINEVSVQLMNLVSAHKQAMKGGGSVAA
jgi:biopolymer transport protein ExbB/TolQ